MVKTVNQMSRKSESEDQKLEGIKSFIKYKYPVPPGQDELGVLKDRANSKVDHRWICN